MNRRIRSLCVALAATPLLVSACSSSGGHGGTAASDTETPPGSNAPAAAAASVGSILSQIGHPTKATICASGKTYTIGYDAFSDTDSFSVVLLKSLNQLAAQLGCVKILKLTDNASPTTAIQNAHLFVERHVDGVITFNIVASAAPEQVAILKAAHIPVVSNGVQVSGTPFVAVDETKAGGDAGSELAKAFQAKYPGQTPYVIVGRNDVVGKVGVDRMNGFVSGIESVVGKLDSSHLFQLQTGDPSSAQSETHSVLAKVPAGGRIVLMGINDDITYGMYQGVKSGGRAADAMVVGIGATPPTGLNYVCENSDYIGAEGYFPEKWPGYLLPAVIAEIAGEKVPDLINFPTAFIPRDQIAKFYPTFTCGQS